jgi:hypothetical protein
MKAQLTLPMFVASAAAVLLVHALSAAADEAATTADASLVFTELVLKPGEDGSRTLSLVRANFRDGKLTDREDLYTGDASEFGFQSQYHLIDGRYVVFKMATVFDLAAKKVVHSFDGGMVLAVEGPLGLLLYQQGQRGAGGVLLRHDHGQTRQSRQSG